MPYVNITNNRGELEYHYIPDSNYSTNGGDGGSSGGGDSTGCLILMLLPVCWILVVMTKHYVEYSFPFNWVLSFYYFTLYWPFENIWALSPTEYPNLNILIRIVLIVGYVILVASVGIVIYEGLKSRYRNQAKKRMLGLGLVYLAPAILCVAWLAIYWSITFLLAKP